MAVTLGRDALELEGALRRIPDVVSCRVLLKQGDHPSVEILMREGADLEAAKIGVVELYKGMIGEPPRPDKLTMRTLGPPRTISHAVMDDALGRPRITSIAFSSTGQEGEASVGLESNGRVALGIRKGRITANQRLRFIAEATLDAAEQLVGTEGNFTLESVADVDMLDQPVVIVLAHCFRPVNRVISGSSPVQPEDGATDQAVVRATLNAINRLLGREDFSRN